MPHRGHLPSAGRWRFSTRIFVLARERVRFFLSPRSNRRRITLTGMAYIVLNLLAMKSDTKTCVAKREGARVRITAFVECSLNKPGARIQREIESALPKDTIAFRLVLDRPGDDMVRSVEHVEPNVPAEVTTVRITDEAGRRLVVPVTEE
jgi:hypothetical protein